MAINLYDSAQSLETAIRQSEEFRGLQLVYKEVNDDPAAKQVFDQFRQIQMSLHQKQMEGQNITEQDVQRAQSIEMLVQQNEKISRLMQAEQRMNMLIGELNQIIMKPLAELYGQF
ncbi:YlbF/YmcA family competence regulator [Neobacillus sp. Marseille-QA0830]